jgi:hypothetical protein
MTGLSQHQAPEEVLSTCCICCAGLDNNSAVHRHRHHCYRILHQFAVSQVRLNAKQDKKYRACCISCYSTLILPLPPLLLCSLPVFLLTGSPQHQSGEKVLRMLHILSRLDTHPATAATATVFFANLLKHRPQSQAGEKVLRMLHMLQDSTPTLPLPPLLLLPLPKCCVTGLLQLQAGSKHRARPL